MKDFFCKLATPWRAGALFDGDAPYFRFLARYNRCCNFLRVLLFAGAAVMLLIGYAGVSTQPYYAICVALLVIAMGLTLIIAQNEKQLPEEPQK